MPIDDALMYSKLTGTIQSKISSNPAYAPQGEWAATTYAEYKAMLKARQETISKMSPDEYKAYRYRIKALKDAMKRTKEARDNIRAAWRTNPQLGFKEIRLVDFLPEHASLTKAAIINVGTQMLVLRIS